MRSIDREIGRSTRDAQYPLRDGSRAFLAANHRGSRVSLGYRGCRRWSDAERERSTSMPLFLLGESMHPACRPTGHPPAQTRLPPHPTSPMPLLRKSGRGTPRVPWSSVEKSTEMGPWIANLDRFSCVERSKRAARHTHTSRGRRGCQQSVRRSASSRGTLLK